MAPKLTLQTVFSMVDKVTKPLGAMQSKIGKMGTSSFAEFGRAGQGVSRFTSLIGAAAAAITTGAMAKAVTTFADTADQVGKTSRVLGLGTKAYQELTYASKMQGVEQEQLEQGVKLLNRSLGEMKIKQGTLYTTLSKTNPALGKQLRAAKDTDEAFMIMMGAIDQETNAQKRATLAQAAFGKSGQNLIKLTDGGIDNFRSLIKEAALYGAVIDDKAIKAGDDFGDSLDRLKGLARGFANQGLGRIVESVGPLLQKGAEWIAQNKDLIGQKLDTYFDKIGKGIEIVGKAWNSGLIPALLIGIGTFKALKIAAIGYNAILAITSALTNSAALPFTLIALAIAAVVGGIYLLVKNWDKVKNVLSVGIRGLGMTFSWLWEGIKSGAKGAFGFVKMIGMTVADSLLSTFGELVKAVIWASSKIGGLLGFDTSGLDAAVSKITELQNTMRGGSAIGLITGEAKPQTKAQGQAQRQSQGFSDLGTDYTAPAVPISPNTVAIESRTMTENRSTLDVNLNQLPPGSTTRQTGGAPGINVNIGAYGRAQAGYR